jgi:hypothetical protein
MESKCLDAIRIISGVFRPEEAVDRLALICLIVRGMQGDAEHGFVREVVGNMGITLTDLEDYSKHEL